MQNKLIYFTMIFAFLVLITGVSAATDERIVKNGTGEIEVITRFSSNPSLSDPPNDASFTISGPETYSRNESHWTKPDAPAGTYTIRYEPVSKYVTPPSETEILTAGDSITFSGYYTLKKRIGERLDFGNGYVVLIKKIDPKKKEVLMQSQLDGLIIDEKKVKENNDYDLNKYGECGILIIPKHISLDNRGEYTGIYIDFLACATPHINLKISSKPEGAYIKLDGEYVGKTPKELLISPESEYSISLELKGYKNREVNYKYKYDPSKKGDNNKIVIPLNK